MNRSQGSQVAAKPDSGGGNVDSMATDIPDVVSMQDQSLFADRSKLIGEELLNLASRYSNMSILKHVNAAAALAGTPSMNRWHLHRLINNAFKARSQQTRKTPEQVKEEFLQIRKSNNIRTYNSVKRGKSKEQAVEAHTDIEAQIDVEAHSDFNVQTKVMTIENLEDEELFANPSELRGDTLIGLAERYTSAEMAARVIAASRDKTKTNTPHSWYSKVDRALKARAKATGETIGSLRDALHQARVSNDIRQFKQKYSDRFDPVAPSIGNDGVNHTGDTTEEEDEEYNTLLQSIEIERAFAADEVEAANGLLILSNDQDIINAASVLLEMKRSGSSTGAKSVETAGFTGNSAMEDAEMVGV